MDYGEHGRCEAIAKSTGERCGRPAIGEHGKCDIHGGKSLKGRDHPNAVHLLRSKHLSEADREIYEEVRQFDNAELIQEEIWSIKTKLVRAAREAEGNGGVMLVEDLIEQVNDRQEIDRETIGAFAKLLQTSEGAVDRAIGRLNDLTKTYHKITEGDTVNVEHSGAIDGERTLGDDEKTMLREALDPGA